MRSSALSYLAAGLAALALAASHSIQPALAADPNERITTEQGFKEKIVGRKLVQKHGYVIIHDDGKITGTLRSKKLTGKWNWKEEYYCRTVRLGAKDLGYDCQVVEMSEDSSISFLRKKGKGKRSPSYRIEPAS